jgi:hypothetical protein
MIRFSHEANSWQWKEYLGDGEYSYWCDVSPEMARSYFDEGNQLIIEE